MRSTIQPSAILILGILLFSYTGRPSLAQTSMLQVMDTARLGDQLDYIQEHTRIYNDFRAIREDVFQKMKRNTMDSVTRSSREITRLNEMLSTSTKEIQTLNSDLLTVKEERDQAIRNRDSLSFLGIQMNKAVYNTIMWVIVLGLAVLAAVLFLFFKRSHVITQQTRRELENTREEFESHKKSSREKYEKLVISHHNEIMKLKRS
ncbi:MAG TPA: hypothetical protein ENO20_08245 [Bacteroides sp.]|nr:hypothetical protein [Bacteroides sp.]